MKWFAVRSIVLVVLVTALLVTPLLAVAALAQEQPYEVWVIDQADAAAGGAKLYIYNGQQLEQGQVNVQVVDLNAAASGVGDGPGVRPHFLAFNSTHSHAIIANVASGHVYVMRSADRRIVASIDVGVQAHAAMVAPDDSYVVVANQNGKRLARIASDFATETFRYEPENDLDLLALENPQQPDNAPICPILFAQGSARAYITLRGGGLFVVDTGASPMRLVTSFSTDQVAPSGCGGVAVGDKIYMNSGTATTSDLYVFDAATDTLIGHIPFTPVGADAHGMAVVGNFLWMANRASHHIVVIDTVNDRHIETFGGFGTAPDLMDLSPDGGHIFVTLRGPNNLTGGPGAKGETPGLAVLRPERDGLMGSLALFVPIGDQSAASTSDPHAIAVRRGVSAPAPAPMPEPAPAPMPTQLPRAGEPMSTSATAAAALLGAGLLGIGGWLRRRSAITG